MLRGTRTLVVIGTLVLAAGPLRAQRRPIMSEEIERAGVTIQTAFDAVERLRPRWLQPPTEVPGARIRIYQGERDMGDVEYLKTIPAERVFTIYWFSMNEAGSRYGRSEGPVIAVTMKPAGPP